MDIPSTKEVKLSFLSHVTYELGGNLWKTFLVIATFQKIIDNFVIWNCLKLRFSVYITIMLVKWYSSMIVKNVNTYFPTINTIKLLLIEITNLTVNKKNRQPNCGYIWTKIFSYKAFFFAISELFCWFWWSFGQDC